MNKLWTSLGVSVGIVVLSVGGFLLIRNQIGNQTRDASEEMTEMPSPTLAPSGLFDQIATWKTGTSWSTPKMTREETTLGNYTGYQSSATITSDAANVPAFEDKAYLTRMGFSQENMFAASGPGSNMWGYRKADTGEAVIFGYKTVPTTTKPNAPLQFNCPCKINLTVFIGMPVGS